MRSKEIRATKLWGGRFTEETNQLVRSFNESLSSDQKFYRQDIRSSTTHVKTLARQGILIEQDRDDIIRGLEGVLEDLGNGKLTISSDSGYEDIHSFVEGTLTERIGETREHLRIGRSRNDQIALDMKLYTRDEIDAIEALVKKLLEKLPAVMEKNTGTFMPGFTHLQKARPVTLAHHMEVYFGMFSRDRSRLKDIRGRMNYCPLGSGALAGTTYPLGREYTAELLGFDGPTPNSMDSVADRDHLIELLSALSAISIHLSGSYEGIIIWNTNKYRFVEIDDSYDTGSSIMPQKRNSDITELIRGKNGRVYSALVSILTTMKGIPLAYNEDIQEGKELTFDAVDMVKGCLALFTGTISSMNFWKEVMEASTKNGFTNATNVADHLVNKGMPLRDVYDIVGQLVLACINRGTALDDLSLKEYRTINPAFEEDVYGATGMKTRVEKRLTMGAPGQGAIKKVTGVYRKQLGMDDAQ